MATAVEVFEAIRPEVVSIVVDGRAAHKLGLAAQGPEGARAQLDGVLDRMAGLLADGDPGRHRGFVGRWVAYHLGEGFSPEDMVHALVTIGDVVAGVARRRLPPGVASAGLVRDLVRATHALVRLVVDVLGAELVAHEAASRTTVVS